jgi:hypothetical protein
MIIEFKFEDLDSMNMLNNILWKIWNFPIQFFLWVSKKGFPNIIYWFRREKIIVFFSNTSSFSLPLRYVFRKNIPCSLLFFSFLHYLYMPLHSHFSQHPCHTTLSLSLSNQKVNTRQPLPNIFSFTLSSAKRERDTKGVFYRERRKGKIVTLMIAECGGSSSAAEKNGKGDNSKSISRIQISLLLSGPISINPKPNRHLFSSSLYQKHCKAFNFSLSHLHLHFFSVFIACPYDTKFLFPTQIIMGRWMLGKNFIPLSF